MREREAFHDILQLWFQGSSMLKYMILSIIFVLISANMIAGMDDDMNTNCSWCLVEILVRTGGMSYCIYFFYPPQKQ